MKLASIVSLLRFVMIVVVIANSDIQLSSVTVPRIPCTCTSHRISVVLAPNLVILTNRPLNGALALQGRYLVSSGANVSLLGVA